MMSGEYLPITLSFSIALRACSREIFFILNKSITILGVIINGKFKNLAAFMALPSSVATNVFLSSIVSRRASFSPHPAIREIENQRSWDQLMTLQSLPPVSAPVEFADHWRRSGYCSRRGTSPVSAVASAVSPSPDRLESRAYASVRT